MKKILAMGNALTDILLQIDNDNTLRQLNLPKGSMQLVDQQKTNEIKQAISTHISTMAAGGSASNTANGIARLGGQAGFFGKIGTDSIGNFFKTDLIHNGVAPHLESSSSDSGQCTVLVSNDGERTLCTFLGAACEVNASDLTPDLFQGYDIFHIEGYLVQNHELIRTAVQMAKQAGLQVSIDLASYNVVAENKLFLQEIVEKYIDMVFANEEEARAFTHAEPLDALEQIAQLCDIAVVKIGKAGSFVKTGGVRYNIAPVLANCIDTTGAGDLYAAGFLYGQAMGFAPDKCGNIASLVSAKVVEVIGAKMPQASWNNINETIKAMN
mgnify:CR=1 FL=1